MYRLRILGKIDTWIIVTKNFIFPQLRMQEQSIQRQCHSDETLKDCTNTLWKWQCQQPALLGVMGVLGLHTWKPLERAGEPLWPSRGFNINYRMRCHFWKITADFITWIQSHNFGIRLGLNLIWGRVHFILPTEQQMRWHLCSLLLRTTEWVNPRKWSLLFLL